ncbi:hypothetical protein [Cedecea neteri]|uniref:hypothetical protein n=1 Tax=Cedecea neteri TaxID=158822 RepID=UPI00068D55D4|nr:hypothetical protein [Cedecea neteri]
MYLNIDFTSPKKRPDESPQEMWELQIKLDECAQELFGPRNPHKNLLQPTFVADGPHVRNTLPLDGGYAELSFNAAGYWPTAIYELAHETVHLLDPRPGYPVGKGATWFEEGLAVNFSLAVSRSTGNQNKKVHVKKYKIANTLFSRIDGDLFSRAKHIRSLSGHFGDATMQDILSVSSNLPLQVAEKLASSFNPKT